MKKRAESMKEESMKNRRELLAAAGFGVMALARAARAAQVGKPAPQQSSKKIRLGVVGGGLAAYPGTTGCGYDAPYVPW